ncbi:NUDIX hydrolase [Glycomyces sp. MUSA5-2]|uniref:NUDIX hydrolase n=1 Tax=Glycomyces sp. MUSA5-2 TaxID=2053002 RepID=UPI00300AEEF9
MTEPAHPPHETGPRFARRAARVLVVDEADRLLLFHGPALVAGAGAAYFFTVGGAIEPGETAREAAVRELHEETGMLAAPDALIGPVARCHSVQELLAGGGFTADEWFFWWRCTNPTVQLEGLEEREGLETAGFAWMSLPELESAPLTILPRALPAFMRRVLTEGLPARPVTIAWDRPGPA